MTATGTASAQQVTVEAVKGGLRRALEKDEHRVSRGRPASVARAIALKAAPVWSGPEQIAVEHRGKEVRARVAVAPTVLAVLTELSRPLTEADYLVLLTPCREDTDLGPSLLGRLLGHEVFTVNSWELLADELGIRMLDPRLHSRKWAWLARGLREVGVGSEWHKRTSVLKLEDALRRLAAIRFGREAGDRLDAAALLDWTRKPELVTRFGELDEDERHGLRAELEHGIGPVAQVVFQMLDKQQVYDALPAGLVFRELLDPDNAGIPGVRDARVRAEERFVGTPAPKTEALSRFADSSEAALLRMMDGHEHDAAVHASDRAEEILTALGADGVAATSRVLSTGLQARLAALGAEISTAIQPQMPAPEARDTVQAEEALTRLWEHRRFDSDSREGADAIAAVRLVRWLASGPPTPRTAAEGVADHMAGTAWVDRAASRLWASHTEITALHDAYQDLYARVRDRRAEIDKAFAERVAAWTEVSSHTDELLLAENLLQRVARPLSAERAPLIVLLDGMSAEIAVQIGAEIAGGGRFKEIARTEQGREGALATFPSITGCSRASLFSGRLTTGGQSQERAGFTALWKQPSWGPRDSTLLYEADLQTGAGDRLPESVQKAVDDTGRVVAAVINTVDDALADGREADDVSWRVDQLGKLGPLLDAAARAGRPVVLTSDHGHVWDRRENRKTEKGESARYRTGEPGERELLVTGDRVLAGGGEIVVPWDERIRYTARQEGYHGGISTAEMVIPVLVFVPDTALVPAGWAALRPADHEPSWWARPLTVEPGTAAAPEPAKPARKPKKSRPAQDTVLFKDDSLGTLVTDTEIFELSRSQISRAPDASKVAAVIDTLAGAGGATPRLPVAHVARAAGESTTSHRAVRFLKMVKKVLNIEGFPVLDLPEGERAVELNVELLRRQFLSGNE
ncbi:hypothetical protein HDA32_001139 [Spinactinospora alkalitolerans]|uniref:PglZ domain-containing protein n=1 Tax=Spinactinospora alkalitolerans TaxID=687207 RepID=A0A852TPV3_9ACTN|nr:BREX-2 system phosphatase PglZ [Spinactinospora alkalitolerans]NYE46019.1 hypothetical protein [Spinactinospora alkalitolerans]